MSSPTTCHRDKSTAIPSIFLTCLNRRVRALQLQRNVSFNCVGVAVFQPRASAWVQRVCGCSGVMWRGWYDWAGPRSASVYLQGLPSPGWLVDRGMAWGRGESKQTQDELHRESSLYAEWICAGLQAVLYMCCGMYCMSSCESEHMCLPVTVSHRLRPMCKPGHLCLLASISIGIVCVLWLRLHHVTVEHGEVRIQGYAWGQCSMDIASNMCDRTVVCMSDERAVILMTLFLILIYITI